MNITRSAIATSLAAACQRLQADLLTPGQNTCGVDRERQHFENRTSAHPVVFRRVSTVPIAEP